MVCWFVVSSWCLWIWWMPLFVILRSNLGIWHILRGRSFLFSIFLFFSFSFFFVFFSLSFFLLPLLSQLLFFQCSSQFPYHFLWQQLCIVLSYGLLLLLEACLVGLDDDIPRSFVNSSFKFQYFFCQWGLHEFFQRIF